MRSGEDQCGKRGSILVYNSNKWRGCLAIG